MYYYSFYISRLELIKDNIRETKLNLKKEYEEKKSKPYWKLYRFFNKSKLQDMLEFIEELDKVDVQCANLIKKYKQIGDYHYYEATCHPSIFADYIISIGRNLSSLKAYRKTKVASHGLYCKVYDEIYKALMDICHNILSKKEIETPTSSNRIPKYVVDALRVLEVRKGKVNLEIVKLCYKTAAMKYHPDRKDGSTEKMQEINRAYGIAKEYFERKK